MVPAVGELLRAARTGRDGWRRLWFATWAMALRVRLRLAGMRLELHAPHVVKLDGWPRVRVLDGFPRRGRVRIVLGGRVRFGHGFYLEIKPGGDSELVLGDHTWVFDGVRILLRGGRLVAGDHVQ